MLVCINVETKYKETEARMGDVTRVFIPEEGRKRRSNEVSYIIVAFYSYRPDWVKWNEGILYCGVLWHIFAI
ncbi:hypothetical protein AOY64_08675 [Escherichia coli]|nr:hypothetical protein [Escherichia coli]EFH9475153.1 hypothetical protein [Escherichia coli]RCP83102.1 hypothetical protein APT27_01745 [Escherichia coli]RCR38886.1 hypothetical protein APT28_01515 [Escherichia coli]UMS99275.1 hypothetical protein AOY64_08675 [Escherichia coli]